MINNLMKISISNIKGNRYKTFLMILIITLFMVLITCFFSFKNSFYAFLNRYLNSNYDFKIIQVEVGNKNYEDIIKKISKIENKHISKIFKDNYEINIGVELDDMVVELNGNYTGFNYQVTNGNDISDKYDLICPDYMGNGDWTALHDIDDYEYMNSKIGQKIKLKFDQKYIVSSNNVKVLNTYNYDLKLVGTYDARDELNGYNKCYISKELFDEVLTKSKTVYSDTYKNEMAKFDALPVLVLVDDFKYVKNVEKSIQDLGLETYVPEIDIDIYLTIFKIINIVTILIVIVSIICMFNYIKSSLIETKKDIALFQVIGYNLKTIKKIYLIQYALLMIVSLLLSLIFSRILIAIATLILNNDPNYAVLKLHLYVGEVLTYFIIIAITVYFIIKILFNKFLKKNSPMELIKE